MSNDFPECLVCTLSTVNDSWCGIDNTCRPIFDVVPADWSVYSTPQDQRISFLDQSPWKYFTTNKPSSYNTQSNVIEITGTVQVGAH